MAQAQREIKVNFRSGIEAVLEVTNSLSAEQWDRPACGEWSVIETVRHLAAVVAWYEEWLTRAENDLSTRPFEESEFDTRNANELLAFAYLDGPAAVDAFAAAADSYLARAAQRWDLPFGYPGGTVTVGLHAGIAAVEWHLHAWDIDNTHEPTNAESLFIGAGACVAAARGGLAGKAMARVIPVAAKRSPWKTLLKESGRGSQD